MFNSEGASGVALFICGILINEVADLFQHDDCALRGFSLRLLIYMVFVIALFVIRS